MTALRPLLLVSRLAALLFGLALVALPPHAFAQESNAPATPATTTDASKFASPLTDDPALEKRVMALSHRLRCLVCQNESIAESHAPIALDLRQQIREQLRAGKTEQQVTDFLVARYGDFVLFRPPVQRNTLLLWFAPLILVLAGIGGLLYTLRRRAVAHPPALTEEEHQRAARLLDSADPNTPADPTSRP